MANLISLSEEDLAEVMRIERLPGMILIRSAWAALSRRTSA